MPSLRRAIHFLVPAFLLVSAALFVPVAVAQDARQENPVIGTYAQATDWLDANRSSPQLPTVLETAIQTAPTMKAVDELVASFFTQADTSADGVVTFSEYHAWALSQPSVFLFFHKLSGLVQGLVDEHKKATSFKNKDSPSPRMGTLAEDEA